MQSASRSIAKLGGPFTVPVIALLTPFTRLSEIRSAGTRPRQRLFQFNRIVGGTIAEMNTRVKGQNVGFNR
jgi:hypothetical protein